MTEMNNLRWALVARDSAVLADLAPLIDARRRVGSVHLTASLAEALACADSIMVAGGETPQSPILKAADGRRVPVGWIAADPESAAVFARAAADVVLRCERGLSIGPAILLAQWDDRALLLADEVERACQATLLRWTAERLVRRDLLDALRCGPGVALYLGHALSGGWLGYGGLTAATLCTRRMQPLGAVLTVACDAGQRHGSRPSFSDELVMRGACAAALGAVGKTPHETNRVLARCMARALHTSGTLGELLLRMPEEALRGYRIAGDPAAALIGAEHAYATASAVYAPAPDGLVESALSVRRHWNVENRVVQR
jgi:Peptidase family C25